MKIQHYLIKVNLELIFNNYLVQNNRKIDQIHNHRRKNNIYLKIIIKIYFQIKICLKLNYNLLVEAEFKLKKALNKIVN